MQRVTGASEFLLVENPGDRVQARPAHLDRHVGGVQAGVDRLGLQLPMQVLAQHAGLLDLLFVRIELIENELARGLDDHLLFVVEREIHGQSPFLSVARPGATPVRFVPAQCRNNSNCSRSCSTCMAAGQSRGLVTALAVRPFMKITTERST